MVILLLLWHVDTLLGGDREICDYTAAVARKRPANHREMIFSVRSARQQLNYNNEEKVFSTRSVPRCYKLDKFEAAVQ
jgi:hypothetical protein